MKTLKRFAKCWFDAAYYAVAHDGIEHAGYLAYLGMLSFFPFMVLLVSIAGVVGEMEIIQQFIYQVQEFFPQEVLITIQPRIEEIVSGPPQGLLTVAVIGMLWTASSAVEGSRTILNRVYRVATPPAYILRRLMSIVQFIIFTIGIIMAMLLMILTPLVLSAVQSFLEIEHGTIDQWFYLQYVFSGLTLFFVIASSYYMLPNLKLRFIDILPGTLVVLVLWMFFAWIFSEYLQQLNQFSVVYGSLGGIIMTLLFFFMLGFIYIFGAEFNYFVSHSGYKLEKHYEITQEGEE